MRIRSKKRIREIAKQKVAKSRQNVNNQVKSGADKNPEKQVNHVYTDPQVTNKC